MKLWVISWTCLTSVPLHLLCLSSRRLFQLSVWVISSQHSCLSSNVTTLEKRLSIATLFKLVLPPPVKLYLINLIWFLHRLYHNMKLSYLCICSLVHCLVSSLLNINSTEEQNFSVFVIAHTATGGSHMEDVEKILFHNKWIPYTLLLLYLYPSRHSPRHFSSFTFACSSITHSKNNSNLMSFRKLPLSLFTWLAMWGHWGQ